jgi:hypothetical protein
MITMPNDLVESVVRQLQSHPKLIDTGYTLYRAEGKTTIFHVGEAIEKIINSLIAHWRRIGLDDNSDDAHVYVRGCWEVYAERDDCGPNIISLEFTYTPDTHAVTEPREWVVDGYELARALLDQECNIESGMMITGPDGTRWSPENDWYEVSTMIADAVDSGKLTPELLNGVAND